MRLKTAILVVLLVLFTWAGAGGISFAVVELTGGGPQGEQGLRGEQGPTGPTGPQGLRGGPGQPISTSGSLTDCGRAVDALIEGLNTPGLSDTQLRGLAVVAAAACDGQ